VDERPARKGYSLRRASFLVIQHSVGCYAQQFPAFFVGVGKAGSPHLHNPSLKLLSGHNHNPSDKMLCEPGFYTKICDASKADR
jgi:hypothetical protein